MRKLKKQNGITLVALVITIIILLILAGISIASLTQKGLLGKIQEAKQKTENAQAEENEILVNYLEQIETITPVAWTWTDTDNSGTKNIGDVVTYSSGEKFYIMSTEGENYALLAEKNIGVVSTDTDTYLKQIDSANKISFSANSGWAAGDNLNEYNEGSLKTDGSSAVYYAVQYGKKFEGGTGRLMTVKEVIALGGNPSNYHTGGCPKWINSINYWLGSASGTDYVSWVNGKDYYVRSGHFKLVNLGVRPVIELSKSLI